MKISLVLAVAALVIAVALTEAKRAPAHSVTEYEFLFDQFVRQHGKTYKPHEVGHRFEIFKKKLDKVKAHNARTDSTYKMTINKFSDLTWEEFKSMYLGFKASDATYAVEPLVHESKGDPIPMSFDWRTKNAVTGIKDQGQCGSCWAFSAVGSLESAHFLKTGQLVSLSEMNVVDCSWNWGNEGCNGGDVHQAFQYMIDNKGVDTEKSYPYEEFDSKKCKYTTANLGATMSAMVNITTKNETALVEAVATAGPVSVAIDVEDSFQDYDYGVYVPDDCDDDMDSLNHAVVVVGYQQPATKHGIGYYIVKNSWGEDWGNSGYIEMVMGSNCCGIATDATYPLV